MTNRFPNRWALLMVFLFSLPGCNRTFVNDWSPDRVISTEEGAVVVWKREIRRGGGFNGFDNNPVLPVRATYRASAISSRGGSLASQPRGIDYTWRKGDEGPFSRYVVDGDQVIVQRCAPDAPPVSMTQGQVTCAEPESRQVAFAQLGEHGERILAHGSEIVLSLPDGRDCRLDLAALGGDVSKADDRSIDGSRFSVMAVPSRSLVYVVDRAASDLPVLVSSNCAPLERIAALREWQAKDLLVDVELFHKSLEVIDIAAGRNPRRPSLLVEYSQRAKGMFRSQQAVVDLESGRLYRIDAGEGEHFDGFWMERSDQLWGLDFLSSRDRHADFRIYDMATSTVRVEQVRIDAH